MIPVKIGANPSDEARRAKSDDCSDAPLLSANAANNVADSAMISATGERGMASSSEFCGVMIPCGMGAKHVNPNKPLRQKDCHPFWS